MKKVEAIIRAFKLETVKDALTKLGIDGMTVSEVKGAGREKSQTEIYRGSEYVPGFVPRIKIEVVLAESQAEGAMAVILRAAKTGKIGDGRIFCTSVEEVFRIRTGDRGAKAI